MSNVTYNVTGIPEYDRRIRIVSMSLFCLVAIVGNVLFIVAYCQVRWLRTARHAFIINLAIADLIMGSFGMPATIASLLAGKWFIDGAVGEFFCNLSAFLDNTAIGCSVWFLALSSFDRYVYICRPLRYASIMTNTRVKILSVIVWISAVTLASMPIIGWSRYIYSDMSYNCGLDVGEGVHRYYFLIFAITVILIPVLFTVFNFTFILIDLNSSSTMHDGKMMNAMESNKSAIVTLLVLTAAFVVCSLPLFITAILYWANIAIVIKIPVEASIIFHWMLYMNSAVNPVLYGALNPKLRHHYSNMLSCNKRPNWAHAVQVRTHLPMANNKVRSIN